MEFVFPLRVSFQMLFILSAFLFTCLTSIDGIFLCPIGFTFFYVVSFLIVFRFLKLESLSEFVSLAGFSAWF